MNLRANSQLTDRYVPLRRAIPAEHLACNPKSALKDSEGCHSAYASLLGEEQRRCLSFSRKKTTSTAPSSEPESVISSHFKRIKQKKMNINFVKQLAANQIIYAPDVVDNYYSHVLDWSKRGPICVALRSDCYLYNNEIISKLPFSTKYVTGFSLCSVKFNREATLLFMGDTEGMLHVVDIEAEREIRTVNSHLSRISCIENTFEWGLLTGSKDCSIAHSDLRSKNSVFMRLMAHKEEVCGLSVQNNKIASGSRDGSVLVWNLNDQNLFKSHRLHKGAVKALQWCPWRANILASGGGHSDHKILLWNSESEEIEQVLEGKSQITGLAWRESAKDLLTAHRGNQRESYAMIWNSKIKQFTHILSGHKKRIVGLAVSPRDESDICTLGADQTMRFWRTRHEVKADPRKRAQDSGPLESASFK